MLNIVLILKGKITLHSPKRRRGFFFHLICQWGMLLALSLLCISTFLPGKEGVKDNLQHTPLLL